MGFPGGAVVENLRTNAGGVGSIPARGTKIPYATWHALPPPKEKKKKHPNAKVKMTNYIILLYVQTAGVTGVDSLSGKSI